MDLSQWTSVMWEESFMSLPESYQVISTTSYVKTLCDLQGVQFYAYLSRQFSIVLDIYLQILTSVNMLVYEALLLGDPHWRLKHACPACTYKLQVNDSLKRVLKKSMQDDLDTDSPFLQYLSELPTMQFVSGDHYLSNDYIEQFAKDSPADMLSLDDNEDNPCAGHWKNMRDEKMKKMWGVFDESGIFMSICRHGFSLLIADMVQSGEQAKYPLAVISKLLNTFSSNLGGGYDIGCRFKTTLSHSSLGQHVHELNHTSLVGAFHRHTHQRLCQLDHLATYVDGLRLEDLEGCERTFSNIFHRHQAITHYFEHNDDYEVYANLSTFLYNNYKQVFHIISDGTISLPKLMHELGLEDKSVFDTWLAKERAYLTLLSAWTVTTPSTVEFGARDIASTNRIETMHRHAMENYEKDLKAVQELEMKLSVTRRWEQEDQEWKDVGRLVANRKFQCALDHLEGLVVARVFELLKMNQVGTALLPPCASLSWEEVVEYTFLSDFYLLHDAHQDISQRPWATPTGRLTMDTYFKMCHAHEEIQCLDIEIQHLATYLHDESKYLTECEKQLQTLHPGLAHQVSLHHKIHTHFTGHHHQCLYDISMLEGFTGSITLGESVEQGPGASLVPDGVIYQIPDLARPPFLVSAVTPFPSHSSCTLHLSRTSPATSVQIPPCNSRPTNACS
ncbi:hypothetical protein BDR05DRAFT_978549 [Suillus weaverae]|nr:hypothetical protein BDR05DRAFT_978549 [Suillus weaverae]